ncbi:hypothetical protein AB6A40_002836 [Gnathostoma spinigerum]|uniref:Cyclin-like domain-containing protein n=1 Tax=Gnathostoma spinigerum TaxID=75299 RepID=A0ABD6EHG8_9BILA
MDSSFFPRMQRYHRNRSTKGHYHLVAARIFLSSLNKSNPYLSSKKSSDRSVLCNQDDMLTMSGSDNRKGDLKNAPRSFHCSPSASSSSLNQTVTEMSNIPGLSVVSSVEQSCSHEMVLVHGHSRSVNIESTEVENKKDGSNTHLLTLEKRSQIQHSSSLGQSEVNREEIERLSELRKPGVPSFVSSSANATTFFQCYEIPPNSGRYYLLSPESSVPLVTWSHICYASPKLESIESYERIHFACSPLNDGDIKPIDFSENQEMSFEQILSARNNVDVADILSAQEAHSSHFAKLSRLPAVEEGDQPRRYISQERTGRIFDCESLVPDLIPPYQTNERRAAVTKLIDEEGIFDLSADSNSPEYDPCLFSNFEKENRLTKATVKFNGFISSLISFVPPDQCKLQLNERFKSAFPYIQVSFTKILSIEKEMLRIARMCDLDNLTLAHAYVFYEKVLLKGMVGKSNRKLVAGAALLVAAKITDIGCVKLSQVVDKIENVFRISRRDLLHHEIPLCVALDFGLHVPDRLLLPHYHRIEFDDLL